VETSYSGKRAKLPVTLKSDTKAHKKPIKIFYGETEGKRRGKERIQIMEKDINVPVAALINDLDALITELDENPRISRWVVRLVLKSIKEKARKMALEGTPKITNLKQPDRFDAFANSSTITTTTIRNFRSISGS